MAQRRRRRWHRVTPRGWVVLAVSVVVLMVAASGILVAIVGKDGGGSTTRGSTTSTSEPATSAPPTSAPPTTDTTTPTGVTGIGTYRVSSTALALEEPEGSAPARFVPTGVWFPATRGPRGLVTDRSHAPYPLLVFSQGYDMPVSAYHALIDDWVSAGFVVAAPTYPLTDPTEGPVDENDIVNHPADLRFVIASVLTQSKQGGTALSGLVNADEIGLVGQSDGGDVSLAVAAGSCCQDVQVKAAAILSGAELAGFGGTYFTGRQVPLLVVQGTADTINPPGCSVQIYDAAAPPKYYLDLIGAGHAPAYTDPSTYQDVTATVTTDFFDATLAGQSGGVAAMTAGGNVAGVTQLSDGPTAPLPPSACPGAPGG